MGKALINCQTPNCAECTTFDKIDKGDGALYASWWFCDKCVEIMDKQMEEDSERERP